MGIIKLVLKMDDFTEVLQLAKKGNRYNLDLKVSDIYDPEDTRVDLIFREFTAASFGKINVTSKFSTSPTISPKKISKLSFNLSPVLRL